MRAKRIESLGKADLGPTLGVISDFEYQETTLPLEPGELIALFPDHPDEARSHQIDPSTKQRIREILESADITAQHALRLVLEAAQQHGDNAISADHVVFGLRRKPL